MRNNLWNGEERSERRCLSRPEHLHIPVVLPLEFSPPDRTLDHFVERGSPGGEGMSLEEGVKRHSRKGYKPQGRSDVSLYPHSPLVWEVMGVFSRW